MALWKNKEGVVLSDKDMTFYDGTNWCIVIREMIWFLIYEK